MERRNITVVHNNETTVIATEAETLKELKIDLANANINIRDTDIFEGLSRTKLIDNDSQLPKDVMYRGKVTNDLVIMVTTKEQKIKSGIADRAALYGIIKKNKLEDMIQKRCVRNFTNVSNKELSDIIFEHDCRQASEKIKEKPSVKEISDYAKAKSSESKATYTEAELDVILSDLTD